MRPPVSASADRVWVCASPAAELLDVANAAYNQMLRLLLQAVDKFTGRKVLSAVLSKNDDFHRQRDLSGVVGAAPELVH